MKILAKRTRTTMITKMKMGREKDLLDDLAMKANLIYTG